ncbi:hypothetical protein HDU67_003503, partial [Dinochytrium kinnereticum]
QETNKIHHHKLQNLEERCFRLIQDTSDPTTSPESHPASETPCMIEPDQNKVKDGGDPPPVGRLMILFLPQVTLLIRTRSSEQMRVLERVLNQSARIQTALREASRSDNGVGTNFIEERMKGKRRERS